MNLKKRYDSVQLLRAITALLICVYHFTFHEDQYGVLFAHDSVWRVIGKACLESVFVFFLISGFVLPLAMFHSNYDLSKSPRFLVKRYLRLAVPYVVSILLIISIEYLFSIKNGSSFNFDVKRFVAHLFFAIPFTNYQWYNPIYWTLALEIQFYILIAFLYPFLMHRKPWITLLAILTFAASGLYVVNENMVFHYAPIFSIGIILFLYYSKKIKLFPAALLLIFSLVLIGFTFYLSLIIYMVAAIICIHVIKRISMFWNKIGDISYSLYLVHGLSGGTLLYFCSRYCTNSGTKLIIFSAALMLSIGCAWFFHKWIEKRVLHWLKRWGNKN